MRAQSHGRSCKRDRRGSNRDRLIRKLKLLAMYGDRRSCPCHYCSRTLTLCDCNMAYGSCKNPNHLTEDRVQPGGRYVISNLVPACRPCNSARQDNPNWVGPQPSGIVPNLHVSYDLTMLFRGADM